MRIHYGRRIRTVAGASLVAATALAVITAAPAVAATSADTTTTFTVSAGALAITAPASKSLGTGAPSSSIAAQLGAVTVTDARAELAPTWAATVSSTSFTTGGATTAETIPASDVNYWSGAATSSTPGDTFVPGQPTSGDQVGLDTAPTAFSLTAGVGDNTATWNPTIVANVPDAAVGGLYTGTVTHSVA
jgi:hypothetical protein